jgi:hypothetical protein
MKDKFATRKGPWGVVEAFEKTSSGVADLCQDVRAIKAITTNTGRLRAWIRMALQQKMLPDIMRDLVSQEAVLSVYYDPFALLLTDDAMQFAGMLGECTVYATMPLSTLCTRSQIMAFLLHCVHEHHKSWRFRYIVYTSTTTLAHSRTPSRAYAYTVTHAHAHRHDQHD